MPLYKIKDFASEYSSYFDNNDLIGFDLYSEDKKVGSVKDLLVDEDGRFRYFVINTGVWILGKKVLLPIGRARIEYPDRRVYAINLSKEQVETLPEFTDDMTADFDYEEKVRTVYRSKANDNDPDLELRKGYDRDTYNYNLDPDLYDLSDSYHRDLKLYQEKLRANKLL